MKTSVRALLSNHPDYLALTSASFLSGLGTTLSGVAIFHELASLKADSFIYALAFALTLLPGLIASHYSNSLLQRFSPAALMVGLELFGALVIGLAIIGARLESQTLLLAALPLTSLAYGILLPFLNTYTRERFSDRDFLAEAEISNLVLVLNFVLGSFLGTLLIDSLGAEKFFLLDILSYLIAAVLILAVSRLRPEPFRVAQTQIKAAAPFVWSELSSEQREAFLIYPILVAACSPCTAVLPGAVLRQGNTPLHSVSLGALSISIPLFLMLAKTKGQFLGPWVVRRLRLDEVSSSQTLMMTCLVLFLACYAVVFSSSIVSLAFFLVVIAHIFSNVVFTLSFVQFRKAFSAEQIGLAATRQYQVSLIIMILTSTSVGYATRQFGNLSAVAFGLIALLAAVVLVFKRQVEGPS